MGVRTHIYSCPGQKFGRPHLVKKYEWANHLLLCGWQSPPYLEITKVSCAGNNNRVQLIWDAHQTAFSNLDTRPFSQFYSKELGT